MLLPTQQTRLSAFHDVPSLLTWFASSTNSGHNDLSQHSRPPLPLPQLRSPNMQGQQRSLFLSSLTRQCWLASKFSLSLSALAPDSAPLSQVTASKVLGMCPNPVCAPGTPWHYQKHFAKAPLLFFTLTIHNLFICYSALCPLCFLPSV